MRRIAGFIAPSLLLGFVCLMTAEAQPSRGRSSLQQIQERHREKFREFSKSIQKLAEKCEAEELQAAADEIRLCVFEPDSHSLQIDKLPTEVRPELPASGTAPWQRQLRHLETAYALELFKQSQAALRQGYPSYAYNLVREAALHDPDHAQVRKILGFVKWKNEWVTPFTRNQLQANNIWHEDFGWLPQSHVERYSAGERYFRPKWVSVEQEKELRRDFKSAWEVRTDHYLIKTNVSLEKGVELGKALEDFYGVFYETFAGFFHSPEQLQKLFEGKGIHEDPKPKIIHFYRTREEYLERMRKLFPAIDQTNGVYLTSDHIAHFYHDPKQDHYGTLFHEATHQLFFESHNLERKICENHHFWIIEGIACYMESFQRKNGVFSLGDVNHIRFVGARNNLLQQNYYVPLQELSELGMKQFQHQPEHALVKNYTQAAGLARFFMHYDNGRYREALVKHLVQLYSADPRVRANADGLDVLTGVEFSELDRQYAEDARAGN